MKLSKRFRWIIVITVLTILSMLFFTPVNSVRAIFDGAHASEVLLRVETEIMQKTPAGRYYDALFWKHVDEVSRIMRAHPEHAEELLHATVIFVPELEALLNGNGDEAYITSEHVKSLKAELDWFASMGNPALRDDIAKEEGRLPLENFVGMTMSEAWDFINSKWTPDMVIQPTATPIPPQPMEMPVIHLVPYSESQLVPGSDGNWAYYVHNRVYLEYPANYYLQLLGSNNTDYFRFIPPTSVPGQIDLYTLIPYAITVHIWNDRVPAKDLLSPNYWYPRESIVWTSSVQVGDFKGVEFISSMPVMHLNAVQYNPKNQIAIHIDMFINEVPSVPDGFSNYQTMINQRYEFFQHMVDSLQIQMP